MDPFDRPLSFVYKNSFVLNLWQKYTRKNLNGLVLSNILSFLCCFWQEIKKYTFYVENKGQLGSCDMNHNFLYKYSTDFKFLVKNKKN